MRLHEQKENSNMKRDVKCPITQIRRSTLDDDIGKSKTIMETV